MHLRDLLDAAPHMVGGLEDHLVPILLNHPHSCTQLVISSSFLVVKSRNVRTGFERNIYIWTFYAWLVILPKGEEKPKRDVI